MTIRRGEPWGVAVAVPDGLTVVTTDGALHDLVATGRAAGAAVPPVGLGGGDLARTVAGGRAGHFTGEAIRLPLDLVRVEADGHTTWSATHVVCRRSWWRGEVVLAMTAQYLRGFDVVPRAHPNDGRVDLLRVHRSMPARVRRQARSRSRTGSHLPHPQLEVRQAAAVELTFDHPLHVWVDGRRWRTASSVNLTVEPDAYVAYV